ncbi:MAG: hypothetical protein DWQ29_16120 [Planctomycetota bacterium]|nr:MAG: hypothetical protein DWQ29_16120 [Planctomycetota bacterium]
MEAGDAPLRLATPRESSAGPGRSAVRRMSFRLTLLDGRVYRLEQGVTMQAGERDPERGQLRRLIGEVLAGLAKLATFVAGGLTVGGSLAGMAWVFELACHFRVQYLTVLLIGAITLAAARSWRWCGVAALFAGWNALLIAPLYFAWESETPSAWVGERWRIVSVNLYSGNRRPEMVIDFLRRETPDVVVAVELTERWHHQLQQLSAELPHQETFAGNGNFGIGVYSAWPIESAEFKSIGDGNLIVIARLQREGETLTVIGAHPFPPMGSAGVARRNRQLGKTGEVAAAVEGPLVLAGDLNTTSWSPAFGELLERASLFDTRRGFGVQPTWPAGRAVLQIPIDHCLVSSDVRVVDRRVGPDVGSDHLPIVVDVRGPLVK